MQDESIALEDEAYKVIINADGNRDGLSDEMSDFLDFLQGKENDGKLSGKLEEAVKKAIDKKEWEVDYMTMLMKLKEENESGQILGYIKALADCNFPKKEIVKKLKAEFQLSSEEIEEKFKEYEAILQPA